MKRETLKICGIPALTWGGPSQKLLLYVHGQGGNKEEAAVLCDIFCRSGWQILSIDLPEHGDRADEKNAFNPWCVIPELKAVMEYIKCRWNHISLFANSIGAWFSMSSFGNENLEMCLFVSPVLDMKQLISKMMIWANVSEKRLEQERIISTSFGQTLSWDYWKYVLDNPIKNWEADTFILYGESDNLVDRNTVEQFSHQFGCTLTVMQDGEHWFHTEQQLAFMLEWAKKALETASAQNHTPALTPC